MRRPRGFQQRGERRIAAALRIALAAALLAVQVLFVVLTTRYLKDHFALIYGALAVCITKQAGLLNMATESMMLSGALCGVLASGYTQSLVLGVLGGMVGGILIGLLISYAAFVCKTDLWMTCIAVNTALVGGTILVMYMITGQKTNTLGYIPSLVMPAVEIPLIKDIPVLGEIVSGHNIITYLSFLAVFVIWYLLFRTPLGLRIRSVGENPDAAKSVGVNVYKTKSIALTIAGVLSGMGGVYMSMGYVSWFAKDLTAGRGWIGIAAAAMSCQHPVGAAVASIFFGVADATANTLQTINLPSQLVLMIPYVVTLLAMCVYAYYRLQKKKMQARAKTAAVKAQAQ